MSEPEEDLILVKKREFADLLRSVDLLTHRFKILLEELKHRQTESVLPPATAETHGGGTKICRQCGRDLDMSARFCDTCGASLTET